MISQCSDFKPQMVESGSCYSYSYISSTVNVMNFFFNDCVVSVCQTGEDASGASAAGTESHGTGEQTQEGSAVKNHS